MIIQDNFRLQFYDAVRKGHTLIVANTDVDSLCATNILTHIFSCDDASYTLSPVDSFPTLEKAIESHKNQAANIVLVNCIGSHSVQELNIGDLSPNLKIWVLESRRPLNLDDIFGEDNIRILVHSSEVSGWELPETSAIYEEASDGEEDRSSSGSAAEGEVNGHMEPDDVENMENEDPVDDASGDAASHAGSPPHKRRRGDLASIIERRTLRRQQKTNWKRNRKEILWNYYIKSWYAAPVSLLMLELAHELGRCTAEMMWCATVGLNSMYIDHLISVETYSELCMDRLRPFIRKFGLRTVSSADQKRGDDQLRINYDKELTLPLYPHWTLQDSMSNDPFFICQGKLWSQRGEDKFKEILAQLGLTLAECRQNFDSMKRERRREVFDILEKHINAGFYSFTSHLGYSTSYRATDFARALSIRLEYRHVPLAASTSEENVAAIDEDTEQHCCERYNAANRILHDFFKLGGRNLSSLNRAISNYKLALRSLNELLKRSIVQSHVSIASRYFLITFGQKNPALPLFSSRHCLFLFTHSLQRAFASTRSARRNKPFFVCAPSPDPNFSSWILITGVMPLAEQMTDVGRKSIIGKALEKAAVNANIELRQMFDSNIVMIKSEDRLLFFNHLEARLEIVG